MKIDRLIGILSVLLQKDFVTAPYLAEKFEVSRRTISRDIESLCRAGIPITTKQGVNGGISIMEHFKVEKTLFTNAEMQDILAGLRSLDSINKTNRYGQLMEKLSVGSSDFMVGNQSILIDLSEWSKDSLAPKIELLRTAIKLCREVEFDYYSPKGQTRRIVQPYYLIFHWSSWYLWGWCTMREDFRLFKLTRMDRLILSSNTYHKKQAPLPDLDNKTVFPGGIFTKILFSPDCKWRLVEEFGPNSFTEQKDGTLLFETDYTNKQNLITWLLTFGDQAEILEPEEIRFEVYQMLKRIQKKYEERG